MSSIVPIADRVMRFGLPCHRPWLSSLMRPAGVPARMAAEEIAMLLRWILSKVVQPKDLQPLLNVMLQNAVALQELKRMSGNLASEIQTLRERVTAIGNVKDSVIAAFEGFDERMKAAVQDALNAGASEEMLASIREANAALKGDFDVLAQAVIANTPAAPTGGPTPTLAPTEGDASQGEQPTGDQQGGDQAAGEQPPASNVNVSNSATLTAG